MRCLFACLHIHQHEERFAEFVGDGWAFADEGDDVRAGEDLLQGEAVEVGVGAPEHLALRVVARHDEKLFREIIAFARGRYDTDKATYHVSATLAGVPSGEQLATARDLERTYLEMWCDVPAGKGFTAPGRQILHCTFGSVLTHPEFGPAVRGVLESHLDTYTEVLAEHFARHLEALKAGM